jgi:hypothetical protein
MSTFKDIAVAAIARGLKVVPLSPREKKPFLPNWQHLASNDPEQIAKWAEQNPNANCGAVCSYENGNWILDIDDFNWFFEAWPFAQLPQTFTVRTGSGGLQFHFKHSDASRSLRNNSLKNPAWKQGEANDGIKAAFLDVLVEDRQGVLPGSTHPNGNVYKAITDLPLAEITPKQLEWLNSLWDGKNAVAHKTRVNPLRPGMKVEEQLKTAGLKYSAINAGDKTFFNYHDQMGKCLVKGAAHDKHNNRQSAFVHDKKTNELYHYCFSAGCSETPGKTKIALAALGLKLEDLVLESWGSMFPAVADFDGDDLTVNEIVEDMAQTARSMCGAATLRTIRRLQRWNSVRRCLKAQLRRSSIIFPCWRALIFST